MKSIIKSAYTMAVLSRDSLWSSLIHPPALFISGMCVRLSLNVLKRWSALNSPKEADEDAVRKEAAYDGFYAVCTNLTDNSVGDILFISEGRWKIEESFRIMKTDFLSRPVYVSREDRIQAHFLSCYLALLVYRLLEKKIGSGFIINQIIQTLCGYKLLKITGEGYVPEYTRTLLTDHLHAVFGFRTDAEIIPTRKLKSIIAFIKK